MATAANAAGRTDRRDIVTSCIEFAATRLWINGGSVDSPDAGVCGKNHTRFRETLPPRFSLRKAERPASCRARRRRARRLGPHLFHYTFRLWSAAASLRRTLVSWFSRSLPPMQTYRLTRDIPVENGYDVL